MVCLNTLFVWWVGDFMKVVLPEYYRNSKATTEFLLPRCLDIWYSCGVLQAEKVTLSAFFF